MDYLLDIGLSKSEAALYVYGLSQGEFTVAAAVKGTGIKRATVYYALNQLVADGLAVESKSGKLLFYRMAAPETLTDYISLKTGKLAQKAANLSTILPLLRSSGSTETSQLRPLRHFTGAAEVRSALDIALFCSSRRWDIIAPIHNFVASSNKQYIKYFQRIREEQGISSRTLWEGKKSGPDLALRDIISRKPRYLPRRYHGAFGGMMILFDDKALLIGSDRQPEAILIQTSSVVELLTVLFDSLWQQAEKP